MVGRGNSFSREYSISDCSKTSFPQKPSLEEKVTEYFYSIDNKVGDNLWRITRAYAKKMGGLPNILAFPRREVRKKDRPYCEDALLVEDFEELVETSLQDIVQPLN